MTNFRQFLASCREQDDPVFFDGGMGTMIQASGVTDYQRPEELNHTHPDVISGIHRAYLEAGAHVLTANTFGALPLKMAGTKYTAAETIKQAVSLAKSAVAAYEKTGAGRRASYGQSGRSHFVAADMGPTGRLLAPMGDLPFDEAYDAFAAAAKAAEDAGADLVIIETMSDLYEAKAALLAVKENTSLPVIVTVTFAGAKTADANGIPAIRTLTGADALTAVTCLEALRPDAIGWNCGGGLDDAAEITAQFCKTARLPVLVQPNAGIPVIEDGKTVYKVTPEQFAEAQQRHRAMGAALLGGCCGTTPAHIAALAKTLRKSWDEIVAAEGGGCCGISPTHTTALYDTVAGLVEKIRGKKDATRPLPQLPARLTATRICSGRRTVEIGGKAGPVLIGERINPTGKKKCQEALQARNLQFVLDEAEAQTAAGAHILDVNVGLPGIDEGALMKDAVIALQKTCAAPLQIDSSESAVLEKALRYYNGKALVNSVNGKQAVMDAVFPLVAKYGGAVVALTLDDAGIPPSAEGRLAIADRIIVEAAKYGIPPSDILVDCLTLTVSAEQGAAPETLRAVALIKRKYGGQGVKTLLGVSNVSFGLPRREIINSRFLTLALKAGLDAAIVNPLSPDMTASFHAHRALAGLDNKCAAYIAAYSGTSASPEAASSGTSASSLLTESALGNAIIKGHADKAAGLARELLKTVAPLDVINHHIVPALDAVGAEYESGRYFLPQLLASADTVAGAFEEIKAAMEAAGTLRESRGEIVVATVAGDIHDIGKNIAKALLENYGYTIIDLGKNVPIETVVQTVLEKRVKLVGLSALMTTTVANMEKTIAALREALAEKGQTCAVMAGGAVLTAEYAKRIGADYYVKDALAAVAVAREVFGN